MNMKLAKVLGKLFLPLGADVLEVLIAEHNHASLCNDQSKLILLRICEFRELGTTDLSTDSRCQTSQRYTWVIKEI